MPNEISDSKLFILQNGFSMNVPFRLMMKILKVSEQKYNNIELAFETAFVKTNNNYVEVRILYYNAAVAIAIWPSAGVK